MNRNWIAPLCGALFAVIVLATLFTAGQGQDPGSKSTAEIVSHYTDNDTGETIVSLIFAIAAVPLLFFAGWVRQVLRAAEGPEGTLSLVAFGGLVVLAAGITVAATIHFALADFAGDIDPSAVAAINAIDYDFFFPMAMGTAIFQLAFGLTVVRKGGLPGWLGWIAIVGGVLSFAGPAGFAGFLIGAVVVLITGIIGVSRARGAAPAAGAPA